MSHWVKICSTAEAPVAGTARQFQAENVDVCLVNNQGELAAVNNWCPHRQGPLAEGWIEEGRIVCPWHAWGFDLRTGECLEENSRVAVYALKQQGDEVLIELPAE